MNKRIYALCLLPMLAMACSLANGSRSVEGSGVSASETRSLKIFTGIEIKSSADVTVTFGETQSVTVETDDDILSLVETNVQGGKLVIGQPIGVDLNPKLGVRITIVMKSLEEVIISGSGTVNVSGLDSDLVRFSIPGSGDIAAQGNVNTVNARINGSGTILCGDLQAKTAEARIDGSGDITVFATESVTANISGSGTVVYRGNPAQVDRSVTGSGNIVSKP